jgi:flagellin-like hook-associated protein FlgL
MGDKNFSGNFSGSNFQFGDNSVQNITSGLTAAELREVLGLMGHLRSEIQKAPLPAATKATLEEHVQTMDQAAKSGNAKSGVTGALKGINEELAQVGTATDHVSGIVSTLGKIAGVVGVAIKTVAPFVAGLL